MYACLARHAGKDGTCFPTVARLAAMCGMSPDQVLRGRKALEARGLLRVEIRHRKNRSHTSNLWITRVPEDDYFVAPDALFDRVLRARAITLYLGLARLADRDGVCDPSVPRLAKMCGMPVTQIKRARGILECSGLLEVEDRLRDDGSLTSNRWSLRLPGSNLRTGWVNSADPPKGDPERRALSLGEQKALSTEEQQERKTDQQDLLALFTRLWSRLPVEMRLGGRSEAWSLWSEMEPDEDELQYMLWCIDAARSRPISAWDPDQFFDQNGRLRFTPVEWLKDWFHRARAPWAPDAM